MLQIIGGKHKKRKLKSPQSDRVRPTAGRLREALFNICQNSIEGSCVLDLFAGSGAIGLEALSRGAAHATFVEKSRLSLRIIYQNISALGEENASTVLAGDVFTHVPALKETYDMIFADPPYGEQLGKRLLDLLDAHFFLLKKNGTLFIEERELPEVSLKNLKIKQTRTFGHTRLYSYMRADSADGI